MEPASIRYKNPGAMWGANAVARKWGATGNVALKDGTGQGNKIAVFPTYVAGICAQLDLWRTSKYYKNKRFADAIAIWSGRNNVPSYISFCKARVPGLTENTIMNDAFWKSPMGIDFQKAQAWHEAGKRYPAPDADWVTAQKRVFSSVPTANTVKKAVVSVTTSTASTAAAGTQAGLGLGTAIIIGLSIAVAVFLAWKFWPRKAEEEIPHPAAIAPPPAADAPALGEDVSAAKMEVTP